MALTSLMAMASSLPFSSPSAPAEASRKRPRHRSLWAPNKLVSSFPPSHPNRPRFEAHEHWQDGETESDGDVDDASSVSSFSSSLKRPRIDDEDEPNPGGCASPKRLRCERSPDSSPEPFPSKWCTASLATCGTDNSLCVPPTSEDWEELVASFDRALDRYEISSPDAPLLLRAIIHECNRMILAQPDLSLLFVPQGHRTRLHLYSILARSLSLLGDIFSASSSSLLGKSASGTPYWLAALDLFEAADRIPAPPFLSKGKGKALDMWGEEGLDEDSSVSFAWGKTLVRIAEVKARGDFESSSSTSMPMFALSPDGTSTVGPPHQPARNSLLFTIARLSLWKTQAVGAALAHASAHEVLVLAQDHFSQGLLRLPAISPPPSPSNTLHPSSPSNALHPHLQPRPLLSRAKEVAGIASSLLITAQLLPDMAQRRYWTRRAEVGLRQMRGV